MECQVRFADEKLREVFYKLKESDERLHKEIEKALNTISKDAFCGRRVRKRLIPEKLAQKYEVKNLFVYNLRKDWRLLYTVGSEEIEVIAIILDWMGHKDYERLFKF